MTNLPRITVWNEFRHEKVNEEVARVYPDGLHSTIAKNLAAKGLEVDLAALDEPENGLPVEKLTRTDVLVWWGHAAHDEVKDEIVERVYERILGGMGLIVLHSAHFSKIFRKLMGTTCNLKWRDIGEKERVWVVNPAHPIASGLGEYFDLEHEEMYGEHFDIPVPDELVFVSWFAGGDIFRSGCCYHRGMGKVFYFQPGHETRPTYHDPNVQQILYNAVMWAAPSGGPVVTFGHRPKPLEHVG
jgi:trehalose utilization protein